MDDVRALKELQLDALREVANIGAGHAATALSQLTGRTVMIGVPEVNVRPLEDVSELLGPSDEVIAAYDAPFPEDRYTAGARIFPTLVPTRPDDPAHDDNVAAWEVLSRFEKPFLCAFSDSDPITKGGERIFLEKVPGTKNQPHTTIEGGGHFAVFMKTGAFLKELDARVRPLADPPPR